MLALRSLFARLSSFSQTRGSLGPLESLQPTDTNGAFETDGADGPLDALASRLSRGSGASFLSRPADRSNSAGRTCIPLTTGVARQTSLTQLAVGTCTDIADKSHRHFVIITIIIINVYTTRQTAQVKYFPDCVDTR